MADTSWSTASPAKAARSRSRCQPHRKANQSLLSEKRLLLVEDDPGLQLALSDRLTAEGYSVETAGDGNVAVTRATGEPFDVIVLDVMLPGRDGFDVA